LGGGSKADTGQQGQNQRLLGDVFDHEISLSKKFRRRIVSANRFISLRIVYSLYPVEHDSAALAGPAPLHNYNRYG
ncbi:hypothetical protein, partial [Dechloromonas hortensis]|uniref:hypothetical protein n=1 Tax=Dechloromonas hortensis TaxID=337779 RepID=UPI001B86489D